MSTASNTSKKFQLARKVIGFHWSILSANQSAQILSSFLKTVASVLGNEKSIKSILISCAEIPSITNTYSNGVIELIFGILDSTKSKTDTTEPLCTTCIRKIPKLCMVYRYCQENISLRRILTFCWRVLTFLEYLKSVLTHLAEKGSSQMKEKISLEILSRLTYTNHSGPFCHSDLIPNQRDSQSECGI